MSYSRTQWSDAGEATHYCKTGLQGLMIIYSSICAGLKLGGDLGEIVSLITKSGSFFPYMSLSIFN